jgi:hypothetical protein
MTMLINEGVMEDVEVNAKANIMKKNTVINGEYTTMVRIHRHYGLVNLGAA